MDLSGRIDIKAPKAQVAAAIRDPEVLRQMIPACSGVERVSDSAFDARIEKEIGPITLRLNVRITVDPPEDADVYQMQVTGRSMIAGSVQMTADLALAARGDRTTLDYSGTLAATGLCAKVLHGRETMLADRTTAMFHKLRQEIEAQARTGV